MSNITSLADVRASLAEDEPVARLERPNAPQRNEAGVPVRGGVVAGEWVPNRFGLPDGCPVVPLGLTGGVAWFLDPIGQVQAFAKPYGKGDLLELFLGDAPFLEWAWPRFKAGGGVDGFAAERAAPALISACVAHGPINMADRERGRGCWTDGGGNLIVHVGTKVVVNKRPEPPGAMEGFVYPTAAKLPAPYPFREDLPFNPAKLLSSTLRTWNWARPDVDPHLMLGWIGAAFLGAALPWRPMAFVTGDKATGKSTLQSLVKGLFGDWLISAADTTPAGLYQRMGLDCLPIAVDELESESDVRKQKGVLKLARLAASGDVFLRGGDRHKGVKFNARSAFLFSSINAPPLEPQDLSRMALLRLNRLTPGAKPPQLEPAGLGLLGRVVLRRLVEEWPRFHTTFDAFAAELQEGGMDGRGQAQFGTLLTCADMIAHEGWPDDPAAQDERLSLACDVDGDVRRWRDLLAVSELHEYEDMTENWRLCLNHLLSVRVDAWRGGVRSTPGQVVEALYNGDDMDFTTANNLLAQAGLKVMRRDGRLWLAIQNQGVLVRQLFDGSKWQGELGAGVWSAALRQGPRGSLWEIGNARINGVQAKATLISLEGLYGPGGVMMGDEA